MSVYKCTTNNSWLGRQPYHTKELKRAHKTVTTKHEKPHFVGYFNTKKAASEAVNKVCETMKAKAEMIAEFNKQRTALDAVRKLDHDILYTNLLDWDYVGDNEFKLDIKDNSGNFHRYKYYEDEGDTVWRRGPSNEKPVGVWVGDEEPNGLVDIARIYWLESVWECVRA